MTVRLERESVTTAHDLELFEAAERRSVYRTQKLSKESPPSVRERVRTQREARLWKTGGTAFSSVRTILRPIGSRFADFWVR